MSKKYIKAGVIIVENNKILLVQEKAQRVYGLWNIPSGTVEQGVTIEQTAINEVKEETGLDVILKTKLQTVTKTFPDTQEFHVYIAEKSSGELSYPPDEILCVKWFSLHELEIMRGNLVGIWIWELITRCIDKGFLTIGDID